mgnify:CR=1 FL=1
MAIKSADQITILDVTDAYSVMLTSEAYTFIGGTGGVGANQSCSTEAVAFCGQNQCASVAVTAGDIVCPTGITAAVSNSGTSKVKITFTTTATVNTACEATIPVVVDGMTMNKKFSFAVARTGNTGATGKGIKGTPVAEYVGSSSNTTVPTSGWSVCNSGAVSLDKSNYNLHRQYHICKLQCCQARFHRSNRYNRISVVFRYRYHGYVHYSDSFHRLWSS